MKVDDFSLIKVIGRGAFGEVQLVRCDLLCWLFVSAWEVGVFWLCVSWNSSVSKVNGDGLGD
jgi:hypothetical protein